MFSAMARRGDDQLHAQPRTVKADEVKTVMFALHGMGMRSASSQGTPPGFRFSVCTLHSMP